MLMPKLAQKTNVVKHRACTAEMGLSLEIFEEDDQIGLEP